MLRVDKVGVLDEAGLGLSYNLIYFPTHLDLVQSANVTQRKADIVAFNKVFLMVLFIYYFYMRCNLFPGQSLEEARTVCYAT